MQGIAQKVYTITNGGATVNLPLSDVYSSYLIRGTATLAAPYVVQAAGTPSGAFMQYTFFYNGHVTTSGANTVTIFGKTLSAQQALRGLLRIDTTYDYTAAAWVTIIEDWSGETNTHTTEGQFNTGIVGDVQIEMGYAGTVNRVRGYNIQAIGAADDGNIICKNNAGSVMATGTLTYPAGSARGTVVAVNPSTNNTFIAGDILTFTYAKTTPNGGIVQLSIKTTRTP